MYAGGRVEQQNSAKERALEFDSLLDREPAEYMVKMSILVDLVTSRAALGQTEADIL